jgi:hypothetical protein
VSSILDALAKIEAAEARAGRDVAVAATAAPRTWRVAVVGAVVVAFASGAALSVWLVRRRPAPVTLATAPAPAAPKAVPVVPPARPAPPQEVTPAPSAIDRPGVVPPSTAAVATARAPAAAHDSLAVPPPVPPPAAAAPERPAGVVVPTTPAPPVRAPAPAPPPAVTASAERPRVRVSFLIYSPVASRRTVALTIEDGSLATLHEGEAAGGVEVTHIHPDHVELRHGGQTFTVQARD